MDMSDFWASLKRQCAEGSSMIRLLYINVGVFIVLKLVSACLVLFNVSPVVFQSYLELPASLPLLIRQPWTLVTYMFMHLQVFHLFFNMLCLYWFGRIFLEFHSQKQLVGVYILGGLGGALFFILAYNLFPYFRGSVDTSFLLGASASIMGVIVSAAMAAPNYPVRLFLFGELKLKYMAIVMVVISMLGVTSGNAGGEFAHLGGAAIGYLYATGLRRGKDMSRPVSKLMDKLANLFRRRPKVKVYKDNRSKYHYAKSDAEYNQEKAANNAAIDKILDKIKRSGYASLTAEEKRQLFDRSKNL